MTDKKPSPGAPPHEATRATRELVHLHTMVGTTQEALASIIGIDPKTLRKHYRDELDESKSRANAAIGGALSKKAGSGDTDAMVCWMKAQARWREAQAIEHTSPDRSMSPTSIRIVGVEADDEDSVH